MGVGGETKGSRVKQEIPRAHYNRGRSSAYALARIHLRSTPRGYARTKGIDRRDRRWEISILRWLTAKEGEKRPWRAGSRGSRGRTPRQLRAINQRRRAKEKKRERGTAGKTLLRSESSREIFTQWMEGGEGEIKSLFNGSDAARRRSIASTISMPRLSFCHFRWLCELILSFLFVRSYSSLSCN